MADKKQFDLKDKIEEIVELLKDNKDLFDKFTKNPVKTLEELIGIDLPDDKIEPLIEGIKAKITVSNISDGIGKLKGLFK